ncbi:hypothetical protein [Variovorax sp. J31P179]|uniref:hypothetical protein n=1 Tax=Variovorax sp. J31P179 TaxID=3053508 RepID=UPI002578832D|nr:hypothetical protein [Variovorax sp. J31P179]
MTFTIRQCALLVAFANLALVAISGGEAARPNPIYATVALILAGVAWILCVDEFDAGDQG